MEIINGREHYNNVALGENNSNNDFSSSSVTSNPDGSVLERLEYVQSSLSGIIIADFIISDMDDFDVPDADADTVRWNPEYITGTEGGSADIDTTTSDCLMVKVDPDATPTEARYSVSHNLPFYADFFTVTTDMATTWGTMGTTGCAAGIHLSKGSAYDNTNYLALERVKSSSVNRITVSGKLNNVAITSTNAAITDDALAFKVSRYDDVWRFYYSLTPYPNEVWVLVAQVEDPSVYMSDQVTLYYEAYSKGSADAETVQADFGHFRYLVGSGGGGQYITGDYDSSWVTANADGNVMEREEYIQDMTQYLYGVADGGTTSPTKVLDNSILSILMTKQSGGDTSDFDNSTDSLEAQSDKLGGFSGDGGVDQDDSVKASLDLAHTDLDTIITHLSTGVGIEQKVVTTKDLNQAANTYDLFTGTTQAVILESLSFKMPAVDISGGALTSIAIQTDDATVTTLISSAIGVLASLTSESEITWTGCARINVGTKIQLTIAGGAAGTTCAAIITASYKAVVAGGTLVA